MRQPGNSPISLKIGPKKIDKNSIPCNIEGPRLGTTFPYLGCLGLVKVHLAFKAA